jgi:hypothetical protein
LVRLRNIEPWKLVCQGHHHESQAAQRSAKAGKGEDMEPGFMLVLPCSYQDLPKEIAPARPRAGTSCKVAVLYEPGPKGGRFLPALVASIRVNELPKSSELNFGATGQMEAVAYGGDYATGVGEFHAKEFNGSRLPH